MSGRREVSSDAYTSVYIEDCLKRGHHYKLFGSDKQPLKRNLMCLECSERTGKTAMVGHGDETKSWGQWRQTRPNETDRESVIEGE